MQKRNMRHLNTMTRLPGVASTTPGVCASIGSDFQARLCFLFQLLTSFFLPLAELKNNDGTDTPAT